MRGTAWAGRSTIGLALVVVALGISPIKATAGVPLCLVENQTSGTGPHADLQQAIDQADPGAVLAIKGVCPSSVLITKDLVLLGISTPENPTPTLLGHATSVIHAIGTEDRSLRLKVTDLTVTGGTSRQGGGIYVSYGRLVLAGASAVTSNSATRRGGGIFSKAGSVRLVDESRVTRNEAYRRGGGILAAGEGRVVVADTAAVRRNVAWRGAGIQSAVNNGQLGCGDLVLRQQSVVSGNRASSRGGGVFHHCYASQASNGVVTITGHTRIAGNTARWLGGGLLVHSGRILLHRHATISHNESNAGAGLAATTRVTVSDHVRFEKNRAQTKGGAIAASYGLLRLLDSVSIRDNRARTGAGISSYTTVVIRGETTISGNTADLQGGGIWSTGDLQITDQVKVRRNQAQRGGGILIRDSEWPREEPRLIMERHATLLHNTATGRGGGIVLRDGIARLRDNARVIENRAGLRGGGILNVRGLVRLRDDALVARNIPDDCVGC